LFSFDYAKTANLQFVRWLQDPSNPKSRPQHN
jgi:hypothetical protein